MASSPCRHTILCILPPHILRNIAKSPDSSTEQRDGALDTLALDNTARTSRITYQLLETGARQAASGVGMPVQKVRTIYNANNSQTLPGTVARSESAGPTKDVAVNEAFDGLGDTFDFYEQVFQRNSIDDEGLHLDATVHFGDKYDNAFWNGQQMVFGDGDGVLFNRFTISLDVIGHELTHGVTGHEANLTYQGQPGALNESVSDVFGCLIKQYKLKQTADKADWLIGQGLLAPAVHGVALRSMKAPGTAYDDKVLGKDPQPDNMSKYVKTMQDNGGVHINSGIPNKAFYLVASNLGGNAWERAGGIWYDTIRDPRLKRSSSFSDFAKRTVINAGHRFGTKNTEQKAVIDAWKQVGVPAP
jgi:Zn-dependent metalloprotease